MNRIFFANLLALALVLTAQESMAGPTNVALGKPVTLQGNFFLGGWGGGMVVPADTVTDGKFMPQSSQWDQGGVWWDLGTAREVKQEIVIDLGSSYKIDSLIVQSDDNDALILSYWDAGSSSWQIAWNVPRYDVYKDVDLWGMQTRPNPDHDTERYMLPASITTNILKIEANVDLTDGLLSVSEVQAFASSSVPEPASMLLLAGGLAALAGLRRKKA